MTFTVAPEAGAQGSLPSFETDAEARARVAALDQEVVTPPPYEPPFAQFESAGQFVLTNDLVASLSSLSISGSQASSFTGSVVAGFDYFLVRNLSIELEPRGRLREPARVRLRRQPRQDGDELVHRPGLGGVQHPLGRSFSLYPRATFGIEWAHRNEQTLAGGCGHDRREPDGRAGHDADRTVRLALRSGPGSPRRPTSSSASVPSSSVTSAAIRGGRTSAPSGPGWERRLSWALPGRDAAADGGDGRGPAPACARFGQAGGVVIWGDVPTSAFWTAYDGTSSSNTSISFSPGVDYFVVDHVAIGVGVS